jgi:hypothetical protein
MKRYTFANKGPALAWAICRERNTDRLSHYRRPDDGSAIIDPGFDYAKFLLICLVA